MPMGDVAGLSQLGTTCIKPGQGLYNSSSSTIRDSMVSKTRPLVFRLLSAVKAVDLVTGRLGISCSCSMPAQACSKLTDLLGQGCYVANPMRLALAP